MKEQAKISKRKNEAKIGKTFKVLFEGLSQESDLLFQGRLEGQAQEIDGYILINDMPKDFEPKIGGIYDVRISEAFDYDLIGEIIWKKSNDWIAAGEKEKRQITSKMAWIKTIKFEDADEKLQKAMLETRGLFPKEYDGEVPKASAINERIVDSHSLIPDALLHAFSTLGVLLADDLPLKRRQHEMIATMVSITND